jgi:hypothetical protein
MFIVIKAFLVFVFYLYESRATSHLLRQSTSEASSTASEQRLLAPNSELSRSELIKLIANRRGRGLEIGGCPRFPLSKI